MKTLDERLKEEAEQYVSSGYFSLEYSTSGKTAQECQKAFLTGAKKLKELLSERISCERIPVYKRPYSNEISHYSYNEEALLTAQLKIAELEQELKQKNDNGCCIVEHGYRMSAEHKIKELEQQAASDKELNRQLANRNADLKEQLDKAESVVRFYDNKMTRVYAPHPDGLDGREIIIDGGKRAREYFQQKGER